MAIKLQIRRDIAANWTNVNPELLPGEICFESDTGKIKIGKVSGELWNDIPYVIASSTSHVHNITDITNFTDNVESVIMSFLVSSNDIDVVYNTETDKIGFNILKSSAITGGLLGSIPYQSAADTTALLAGNTTTNKKFLAQTGDGTISASPVWSNITTANITDLTTASPVITAAWQFNQIVYTRTDLGNMTGLVSLNLNNASYFTGTLTGNTTLSLTVTSAGTIINNFGIKIINGGAFTVTWPASIKWASGTAPTLTPAGQDLLTFISDDNGTTWLNIGQVMDIK